MFERGSFPAAVEYVHGVLLARERAGLGARAARVALDTLLQTQDAAVAKSRSDTVSSNADQPASARVQPSPSVSAPLPPSPVGSNRVEPFGSVREQMASLRAKALGCKLCAELVPGRSQVVFGQGNPEAELMLVGDAPGAEEDQEGLPFAGMAGEMLQKMLTAMGLSSDQVYITSALKCFPAASGEPGASRPPHSSEVQNCLPHLRAQISAVRPRVIVAFGAGAMHALFGGNSPVGTLRSRWHDLDGIPVMPTFHPRYLLQNTDIREKRKVWEDLLQVMERLGLSVSEKQRQFFSRGA